MRSKLVTNMYAGGLFIVLLARTLVLGERLPSCFRCVTRTENSACHLNPTLKSEMTQQCPDLTSHCLVERQQSEAGRLIMLERRCSTREETKAAENGCRQIAKGTLQCLTFCSGDFCNDGLGRLYRKDEEHFWNYDDNNYADYLYDPEKAVLSTDQSRLPVDSPPDVIAEDEKAAAGTGAEALSVNNGGIVATPCTMAYIVAIVACVLFKVILSE